MLTLESFEEASEIVKKISTGNEIDQKQIIFRTLQETRFFSNRKICSGQVLIK